MDQPYSSAKKLKNADLSGSDFLDSIEKEAEEMEELVLSTRKPFNVSASRINLVESPCSDLPLRTTRDCDQTNTTITPY